MKLVSHCHERCLNLKKGTHMKEKHREMKKMKVDENRGVTQNLERC